MARVVLKIKNHINNYRFGFAPKGDNNILWQESNILNINNSGNFTVYVKDLNNNIVKQKNIYILCLNDEAICNLNIYPIQSINECIINIIPVFKLDGGNEICNVDIYPVKNISICNIETYTISKIIN